MSSLATNNSNQQPLPLGKAVSGGGGIPSGGVSAKLTGDLSSYTVLAAGGGGGSGIASMQGGMSLQSSITCDKLTVAGKDINSVLSDIQSRLCIIDDPSPERLEKFAALRSAYKKFKEVEALFNAFENKG